MRKERKLEIEQLAMDLLDENNITENPGKHLDVIAKRERITVLPFKDWLPETCGKILYVDNKPVIFYNEKHDQKMVNFTIAHELGHHFLKHLENQQSEIICMNRDLQKTEEKKDQREVEANFFAACLLIPLNILKPAFDEFMDLNGRYNGILYVDKQPCNYTDYKICIHRMQAYFCVSETAIRYRLMNLGWMQFNMPINEDEAKGISLAKYLERSSTND